MWFIFSLLCALSLSVTDLLSKVVLKKADLYLVAWARVSVAFFFLIIGLLFIPIPQIKPRFWLICLFLFPIEIAALFLYIKAIQVSPLSLTIPFLSLTPLFLILTSYLILGERLEKSGILGIVLIVLGSYLLNLKDISSGFLRPVKAILYEKGSLYMIIVAALYSITSNLGKMAIQETSPVFFALINNGITALLLIPFPLAFSSKPLKQFTDNFILFLAIGFAWALMALFHMLAVVRIEVAYMISIKRMSPVFSVLLGYLFLHEEDFKERFVGTIIMFLGVLLVMF